MPTSPSGKSNRYVSGIKRHIGVDTNGLPHAAHVTTANISDKAGARVIVTARQADLQDVEKVLVDGGYIGKPFADAITAVISAEVEVVKRSELHNFKVIPKRWVVERSLSWLEKCRRLWKNCERTLATSLQMMVLAFLALLLKRF
ncbi:hypothetical protein BH23PAT2_BH23PAT2_01490 [soil metagenome]